MEKKTEALQEERVARSIPCDAELQELMQQIDIMVNNKKLEWEKRLQSLEAKMTVRDQELASAQSKLEQKGQEVGVLRQKLDNLQKSKYELVENYDTQLQGLKTQFSKLTQSYEKLQLHQLKQNKAHVVETFKENEDVPFQMSSLNQKLEEFRAKSREWDKQEMLYQNHLVSLDAQRKLLSEKCNLLQRQTQNYQIQIHYQRPKAEDTDPGNQCKTEHVGVQCDDLPEPVDRSDLFMEKLQSTVSEIAESRNRLQEENLKFRQEVKMYQRRCQTIEAKLTEVTNDLKSRNDLLNMVQMECQRLRQEVTRLEELKSIEASQVKLQSSYAQCVKDLEIKKAQILFLERQQQNQKRELNQRIDLTKKEPKTYWDSSNRASHENERFHNEFVNLPKDSDIPLLVKPIPYFGTNHANPTSVIMQEKKEKPMENENEWTTQSATYEHSRTQIPTWHARGDIFNTESSCALPPQVRSRSREPIADGRSPSPPNVYLERHGTYFPEEPKPGMLLKYTYVAEASQMPSPETLLPATVTEKFRQEEEKRARDFELVLNSHIEELQMQSENTLKKYARFKQNQHR
uniref:Deuterosome assembly protein 1 n=1 Tax=Anolis carolinensis TaxID=28377 RepID=A0A803TIE5_ANOCA